MPEKKRRVKVGVIGGGWVSENRHLPALKHLPQAEVVALAEIDPERLMRLAETFRIPRRYPDFRSLLADQEIEAVAVCVPTQFHYEVALAALDARKHLLVEKPLALTLEECDRLIARAAGSSLKVMIGFNLRWNRPIREARKIVGSGTLGRVKVLQSVFTSRFFHGLNLLADWKKQRALGGGVVIEQAVHQFDLWRFLLQTEVEEISAYSHGSDTDDETAIITAKMSNGVLSAATCSWGAGENQEVKIFAEAGTLEISTYRFDGLMYYPASHYPGDVTARLHKAANFLSGLPRGLGIFLAGGEYLASFHSEWRYFLECILEDRPPAPGFEDGRRALAVCLAAVESASSGRTVKVT